MSKASPVSTDPRVLRPIIEALIFASEEPLAPRLLVRLLAGERDEPRSKAAVPTNVDAESSVDVAGESTNAAMNGSPSDAQDTATLVEETSFNEEALRADEETENDFDVDDESTIDIDAESGSGNPEDLANAYSDLLSDEPIQSIDQRLVRRLVEDLNNAYEETGRAFRIVEVAGGFQFATIRDFGEYVALLSKEKLRRRLSPAALETLAIIAFRQPISKPEIESIRGVNSDQVLLSLLEKNLVSITGRSESVGRPLLYGTSEDFLRIFGLNSLSDLPKLREIEELMEDNAYSAERLEVVNVPLSSDAEAIEAAVGAAGHTDESTLDDADAISPLIAAGDGIESSESAIDIDWVDEVGAIGEDDGGLTHDSDAHVLDEVEAIDASDNTYDTSEFTIGADDGNTDEALAHDEHDTDGAARVE